MTKRKQLINVKTQLGALIGLGCPKCGGYVTVQFFKSDKYQAACENCDLEYWVEFDQAVLEAAAPKLLAACVLLVGTVMRDTDAATIGSEGYKHVQEALTAIAEATGYPREFWEDLGEEIKKVTQEIKPMNGD